MKYMSKVVAKVGDKVKQGDVIGLIGSTGNSTGPHLHFEIIKDSDLSRPLNPETLINKTGVGGYVQSTPVDGEKKVTEKVWEYFQVKGYSKEAIAGIMGNIYQESRFNPKLTEAIHAKAGDGIGLCQWSSYPRRQVTDKGYKPNSRKKALLNFAKHKGKHWSSLGVQLEFLNMELCGKQGKNFSGGIEGFKNHSNIFDAALEFCNKFERPNPSYANYQLRKDKAREYYDMYKGKEAPSGDTTASLDDDGDISESGDDSLYTPLNLRKGDKVLLVRMQGGQKFVVLDRLVTR